tara:strand:+ start:153 stop:1259 length:1107 start_codon:yes stop_codon:yes gene_type:complete
MGLVVLESAVPHVAVHRAPGTVMGRLLVLAALVCGLSHSARGEWQGCQPDNNSDGTHGSASAYARMIEPHLGVPPRVDCAANVEMPITVEGVRYRGNPGLHRCDQPSLQVGDCMSGSSVQRYGGHTADGAPLRDVVWVSFCRHDGRDTPDYDIPDSVQLIGYNRDSGATAFFESGDNSAWTSVEPETNRLVGVMPGLEDADAFDRAYTTPGATQCVICHQADPFIHNPFIDGAVRETSGRPVVPHIGGRKSRANTPYYVLGASDWDMRTIHIEGNACLDCHRMGMKTVEEFIGDFWHPDDHMPPREPGSLAGDFAELKECWLNGPEATPGCDWVIPPAGDCAGQVVGDDYPYKSPYNRPQPENLVRRQ